MATSTFSGAWGSNLRLITSTSVISKDEAKREVRVRYIVKLAMSSYGLLQPANPNKTLKISGDYSSSQTVNVSIGAGQTKELYRSEFTIQYGDRTDFTINLTASLNISFGNYGSTTNKLSMALPKLESVTKINFPTKMIFGKQGQVVIDAGNANYTHDITATYKNNTVTVATGAKGTINWTPPQIWAPLTPTESGRVDLKWTTRMSGKKLNSGSKTINVFVDPSVVASPPSVKLTEQNSKLANIVSGNTFVQILSSIKIDVTGDISQNASPVKGYNIEIEGTNFKSTDNGVVFSNLNFSGTKNLKVTTVDARGRTSKERVIPITIEPYFPPTLSLTAQRTRSNPSTIQVIRNASIAPITVSGAQKNKMTIRYNVKQVGSNNVKVVDGLTWSSTSKLVESGFNLTGSYPANSAWEITGEISDLFFTTSFSVPTIPTESVVMYYDKDNKVGIGKPADSFLPKGSLDVAGSVAINGRKVTQVVMDTLWGGGDKSIKQGDLPLANSLDNYDTIKIRYEVVGTQEWHEYPVPKNTRQVSLRGLNLSDGSGDFISNFEKRLLCVNRQLLRVSGFRSIDISKGNNVVNNDDNINIYEIIGIKYLK